VRRAKRIFEEGTVTEPRAGKKVGLLTVYFQQVYEGKTYRFRRVMRAAERTIDRKGQLTSHALDLQKIRTGAHPR